MVMSFIESGFATKVEYEAWLAASIEVHYWPMFGRAGSLIRMLEHTGTPYKHVGPPFDALGSAWEGTADVFAVPIVKDGDYIISQSVAAALYVGKRTGLTPVGYDVFKATQYCMDLVDTFEGNLGKNNEHGPTLKKFLTGDRWAKLLGSTLARAHAAQTQHAYSQHRRRVLCLACRRCGAQHQGPLLLWRCSLRTGLLPSFPHRL